METTSNHQPWVARYLRPLGTCYSAMQEASQYPDPQSAWDAWSSPDELIWTLLKLLANPCQLLLCCCELVEPVLKPMFREINSTREKRVYLGAFNATREWATSPTSEILKQVDYFYDDIVGWSWPWDCPIAVSTGKAVEKLVLAVRRPRKLLDLPSLAKEAVSDILRRGWRPPLIGDTADQYAQRQCDTIRRYFPVTPLLKAYR